MKTKLLFMLALMCATSFYSCSDDDVIEDDDVVVTPDSEADTESDTESEVDPETDIIAFEDAALKSALIDAGVDTDEDGEVSFDEALAVTKVDVSGITEVSTLVDLAYFTNLEELNCSATSITALDLAANTELTWLDASSNAFAAITKAEADEETDEEASEITVDLLANTKLVYIDLRDTGITSIDVSTLLVLEELYLSGNITSLDLSNNTALRILDISGTAIEEIDLSKNTALESLILDPEVTKTVYYDSETQDPTTWGTFDSSVIFIDINDDDDTVSGGGSTGGSTSGGSTGGSTTTPEPELEAPTSITWVSQGDVSDYLATIDVSKLVAIYFTTSISLDEGDLAAIRACSALQVLDLAPVSFASNAIPASAFAALSNLSVVTLPDSTLAIMDNAFSGCALTSVTYNSINPPVLVDSFTGFAKGIDTLNVPSSFGTLTVTPAELAEMLNSIELTPEQLLEIIQSADIDIEELIAEFGGDKAQSLLEMAKEAKVKADELIAFLKEQGVDVAIADFIALIEDDGELTPEEFIAYLNSLGVDTEAIKAQLTAKVEELIAEAESQLPALLEVLMAQSEELQATLIDYVLSQTDLLNTDTILAFLEGQGITEEYISSLISDKVEDVSDVTLAEIYNALNATGLLDQVDLNLSDYLTSEMLVEMLGSDVLQSLISTMIDSDNSAFGDLNVDDLLGYLDEDDKADLVGDSGEVEAGDLTDAETLLAGYIADGTITNATLATAIASNETYGSIVSGAPAIIKVAISGLEFAHSTHNISFTFGADAASAVSVSSSTDFSVTDCLDLMTGDKTIYYSYDAYTFWGSAYDAVTNAELSLAGLTSVTTYDLAKACAGGDEMTIEDVVALADGEVSELAGDLISSGDYDSVLAGLFDNMEFDASDLVEYIDTDILLSLLSDEIISSLASQLLDNDTLVNALLENVTIGDIMSYLAATDIEMPSIDLGDLVSGLESDDVLDLLGSLNIDIEFSQDQILDMFKDAIGEIDIVEFIESAGLTDKVVEFIGTEIEKLDTVEEMMDLLDKLNVDVKIEELIAALEGSEEVQALIAKLGEFDGEQVLAFLEEKGITEESLVEFFEQIQGVTPEDVMDYAEEIVAELIDQIANTEITVDTAAIIAEIEKSGYDVQIVKALYYARGWNKFFNSIVEM